MTLTNGKWSGFRELVLIDVTKECEGIKSFYFKAKDGAKLVRHIAGQFLPIRIKTDNPKYKDIIRTYSLSMIPNEDVYRISVKIKICKWIFYFFSIICYNRKSCNFCCCSTS